MIVHVVLNSHLDPIWLWNLEQGIDAALATARTACGILDDYPEAHVTRGEAWFYETVARRHAVARLRPPPRPPLPRHAERRFPRGG